MKQSDNCAEPLKLAHVMVEHPVCAHLWQTVADVRRTMLVSDFSVLPLADRKEGEDPRTWRVLTADDLVSWLGTDDQRKGKHDPRKCRMGMTVKQAKKCGLGFRRAPTERECTLVQGIWNACEVGRLPLLVTREERGEECNARKPKSVLHLVGIVTSFDLL